MIGSSRPRTWPVYAFKEFARPKYDNVLPSQVNTASLIDNGNRYLLVLGACFFFVDLHAELHVSVLPDDLSGVRD